MNKVLDLDDYFVQKGIEELPGSLKKVLSRVVEDIASGAVEGKAPDYQWERAGDDLNVVPSKHKGDCKHLLVGVCYDKDNFENRIREWLDHASTTCQGINMVLSFFTTQWNSFTADKFKGYIASLQKNVVEVNGRFLEQILSRNEIDIGLTNLPPENTSLLYRKLASDPLVIVAPLSDYDVDIEEEVKEYSIFNNEKFILLKKWQNIRKVANQVFTAEHINPREIIEVQSISASLSLLSQQSVYAFTTLSSLEFIRPPIRLKKYLLGEHSDLTGLLLLYAPSVNEEILESFYHIATEVLNW